MNKPLFLAIAIFVVIVGAGIYLWESQQASAPVTETPMDQQTPDQEEPVENPGHPLITVTSPAQNQAITSPLSITGQARGQWYFEATFPIVLEDSAGNTIAQGFATAQGDWMTTEYVPFTATLQFTKPASGTGTLILQKSNASGLPENDDQIEIPVRF